MIDQTGLQRADADLLGAFVGNESPDLSSIPGIKRDDRIVFEYGTPETAFRITVDGSGYKFEIRDKGSIWSLAWFSCLVDAERYVLVREGEVRNDAPWFDGKATTPAGVDLIEENSDRELRWHIDGVEHIVRTLSDIEWSLVYRLAWVRARSLAEVIEIVSGSSPGKQVGSI
ncbi:hypothetical protein [Curtobacterium aurantiacum]|uniref:hypothetical protein n=1 Tax=Curtobacterium aurantiacum TaxID=3236919 RepID=UPI001BDF9F74|nr:hypothetical protein [Curtobacterium flaccumfaciens]MBT1676135.1 hypothetical protein [Curtobacterium flaccumfaciens pv. flaccumfaciens]